MVFYDFITTVFFVIIFKENVFVKKKLFDLGRSYKNIENHCFR